MEARRRRYHGDAEAVSEVDALEAIERVRRAISGPRAPAGEVAEELGALEGDEGAVRRVGVVAVPGTDDVSHVDLELRTAAPLAALRDAFGEGSEPPKVHWDEPRSLFFQLPSVAVIAQLVPGDEESVRKLSLRRDA